MMEFRAHLEKVRYCFSVPTIAECALAVRRLDSIKVGIDRVSSRHHSHPTFDCGIVTLRYGLPYNTSIWIKYFLPNKYGTAKFGCPHGVNGSDAFQKYFIGRSVSG